MVARVNTSTRPAPQASGTEEDLLPPWTPVAQSVKATFTVNNEWTLNTGGWIDQYGVDINPQNANAVHVLTLTINGVVKDSLTTTPSVAGMHWQNITPLLVATGTVVRVSVQVTQIGNQAMYYDEAVGFFATLPTYCSSATGWRDAAAPSTTAYDCHCLFIPGTASPDWDVVAYGGSAAGGGGGAGLPEAPQDGQTYGRLNAAWATVLPLAGGTMTGAVTLAADPANPLEAATKQYVDSRPTGAAASKTYAVCLPGEYNSPAANYATWTTRNTTQVLAFNDTTLYTALWQKLMPEGANLASGLLINIAFVPATAATGAVVWGVAVERTSASSIDTDSFDTAASGTVTVTSSTVPTSVSIPLTTIGGTAPGDVYRLRVYRDAGNAADTMAGDAQLIAVEIRSAAA
jgi:hypothetical protein